MSFIRQNSLICATLLALSAVAVAQTIPAFPGAEGYGAYAVGGRNGDVYHVTNLNASGAGSFADAIATVPSAGRTIVFDVSGYIRFPSGSNGTRMTSSKVTIAGQTAPGDGIGFYNNFFRISGDDIVIRHVRFRHGKYGSGGDCVDLDSGCLNAILDHVSMQFSTDENISSFTSPPENLTLQYSLNSWGLESHSCGGLWDQNHATSHHNLWSHNHTRNPKARPNGLLEWINNVTFDWDIGFIMGDTQSNQNYKSNVINNYFIGPTGNTHSKALVKGTVGDNGKPNFTVFLSGNMIDLNGDGAVNGSDNGYGIVEGTAYAPGTSGLTPGAAGYYQSPGAIVGSPVPAVAVATDSALLGYQKIVSNAGALRPDAGYAGGLRDEVDTILIGKLTSQARFHVTRENDTGASASGFGTLTSAAAPVDTDRDGMPDYYENALGWGVATDDHKTTLPSTGAVPTSASFFPANTPAGYTRLEEYLHYLAIPHGTVLKNISGSPTSLTVDLRKYTSGFSSSPTFTTANPVNGTVALSGTGNAIATFTPTVNATGRARFEFTVIDSQGSTWTQAFAIIVTNTGLPRSLVWLGNNSTNTWDYSANHWLLGATQTAFSAGDNALIDDRGSNAPAMNLSGTVQGGGVTIDGTKNYSIAGGGLLSGSMALTKSGTATLAINNAGASTFSGGTILNDGAITLASVTANNSGLGTGTITFINGTLSMFNNGLTTTAGTLPNALEIVGVANVNAAPRCGLSGAVTGAGTLNYYTSYVRADLSGDWSAFAGTVNADGGDFRFTNSGATWPQAHVNLANAWMYFTNTPSGGATPSIGDLQGISNSRLRGGPTSGRATTFTIGGLDGDSNFAGIIDEQTAGATVNIIKAGSGTLTLGGACTYTGTTTVNSGWLLVAGSLGNSAVTVVSGAALGGSGTIANTSAPVTVNTGAFLSPGTAPFTGATMTVGSGGLSLGAPTLYFDMSNSTTNDKVVMNGGTLTLSAATAPYFQFFLIEGTLNGGTYPLITGGTNTSAPSSPVITNSHNLPSGTRQTFALQRSGSGSGQGYVNLVVTGNPATLTWTGVTSANWDTTTANNWKLGATPDVFGANDAVIFDDTSAVRSVTLGASLAPRAVTVNTTAGYTLAGAGALTGGSLTKSGAGTLTISNAGVSTFGGSTTINVGMIALADSTANATGLGTGPVILNGGTLKMAGFDGDNAIAYSPMPNAIVVPAGVTGTLQLTQRAPKPGAASIFPAINGALSGAGTLNLVVKFVRGDLQGDWSAFTGTLNVQPGDGDGGDFRFGTSYYWAGMPQATINLGANVAAYYIGTSDAGGGTTIELGELSGTTSSWLAGGTTGGRNFTYRIGSKTSVGNEVVYAGTIAEQNSGVASTYVKTGAGTWNLSGTCTWNGGTTVEEGTLKISGSVTCGAATSVASAATLHLANGSLATDALGIASGAMFSASGNATLTGDLNNDGTAAITSGTFSVSGDVVNNGTMRFTGGAALNATGHFVNNGTIDLLTGAQGLPADFENNGVVIDSSSLSGVHASKASNVVTLTVKGYLQHAYQLQRSDSLVTPSWINVGGGQNPTANDQTLTFTDSAATDVLRFYRIVVTP